MRYFHIIKAAGQINLRFLDIAATAREPSDRAVPRRHGCTANPERPFANEAVILSILCFRIVCFIGVQLTAARAKGSLLKSINRVQQRRAYTYSRWRQLVMKNCVAAL
jgi:hypothetical protein